MFENKLVLLPVDPDWEPGIQHLPEVTRDIGLSGKTFPSGSGVSCAFIGDSFLQLVIFLGCSPRIEIDAPADGSENFCHLRFPEIPRQPVLRYGNNTRPARCPNCRKPMKAWFERFKTDSSRLQQAVHCDACGYAGTLAELDWRQTAGFGRTFIEVAGIFPNEAVPSDSLMARLKQATQVEWRHFYL